MATTTNSDTLPTKESVVKKEPLPVLEVSPKKVVLVKENSKEENSPEEENQKQSSMSETMEVDPSSEDVISASNET
jgi:hypothetical protein